jgi:uncharacterized protein YegJ (DUF2314 family)
MTNTADEEYGVAVPRNDPDMEQAALTAQQALEDFIRRLNSPSTTQQYQAVKIKSSRAGFDEYVWVPIGAFDQGDFLAATDEQQSSTAQLTPNNPVHIRPDQVLDWMVVDDGKLVGGYSLRVMRAKMDPEQRRKFDELAWYKFD